VVGNEHMRQLAYAKTVFLKRMFKRGERACIAAIDKYHMRVVYEDNRMDLIFHAGKAKWHA
jgi:hypothetical protein